jgi:hypothetical protein
MLMHSSVKTDYTSCYRALWRVLLVTNCLRGSDSNPRCWVHLTEPCVASQ